MADIKVVTRNNTLYIGGKAYPDGSNITASSSHNNVSIYDSNNNKYIVKNHPYTGIVDASGTALAASASATASAVSGYINSSNPEGNIKVTDKVTALRGLSTLDFASGKANQFVYATGVDDGMSTTDKVRLTSTGEIIIADNVTVAGNIGVTGTVDNVDVNALSSTVTTLSNTVSGINSYPSADATKVGHISVTQAVDLDQMESDIAANNAKISYPSADSSKLAGIAAGAEVNVNADWNATTGDALILNKPTIPTATSQLTNDSGFVTSAGITDVVQDTTPQLGGNLDLNGSDITGTGDINITGSITSSTSLSTAILLTSAGISNSGTLSSGDTTINGTLSSGAITSSGTIRSAGLSFVGSGTTTIEPVSSGVAFPDDLEISSNGNVTIVLDDDDNETDQHFRIQSGDGTLIWQVNESGVTSGLLTTVTPTFSGTQSSYQQGSSASLTISNHISGRSYQGAIYNSSGVEQTANPVTIDSSGGISFTVPATIATGYELRVFSADVGKLRSAEATVTFEVTASRNFSYWRLQVVNSSGAQIEDKVYLLEIDFYTGANATGTVYPTAAVASSGSGGGATITSGYFHSATYADWKAFDNSTGSGWWTLGLNNLTGSNEDLNWVQMELTGGPQTIQSVRIRSNTTYTDADYIQILGSNTGNFTGEEILCGTLSGIANSSDVTQNI